jgi:hypothetical protein
MTKPYKVPPEGCFQNMVMVDGRILHLVVAGPMTDDIIAVLSKLAIVDARVGIKKVANV